MRWRADLVESQCRAGRAADASRTLAAFERVANATGRRWALAAAARCRALLAPAADLDGAFAEAHRLVADGPSPFELARTELCWGERLRREHRRVEARRHLDEALRTSRRSAPLRGPRRRLASSAPAVPAPAAARGRRRAN